jgi:hypothetical protein
VLQYPGCSDTISNTINITGLPQIGIATKSVICNGEKTTFTLSGATSYSLNSAGIIQNTVVVQPTVTSVYTVTGTDLTSGCSALQSYTLKVLPCLGLDEPGNSLVNIYPNPLTDHLNINLKESATIKILDMTGEVLLSKECDRGLAVIETKNYPPGVYFIVLHNASNNRVIKLIKTN